MTVLVSGGAGYIGGHMVLNLVDRGEPVCILDNLSTGFRWSVPPAVPLIVADAGDFEAVLNTIRTHGVRSIIHFAARIVVPESVADPLGYYLANTVKTRALIAAAVAGGVKEFIFSSTAAVYGETSLEPVSEAQQPSPMSPYGTSKWMSEMMLRDAAAAHGFRYAILRYFNVAGADPAGRYGQSTPMATHLIKVAAEVVTGKRTHMEVFGQDYPTPDGTCVRDYIHVSDLAAAHAVTLDYLRGGGPNIIVNAGYGRGYSVREVIDTVRKVSGVDFEVRQGPRRAGDPPAIVANAEKLRRELGWVPKLDHLDAIVSHALGWEAELRRRGLG
ncbi:MAG: UDP-glucose 4-epimerase GalE [Hyphomicrobiales bacterium]|nr:UDP-glucose 4-epimerase GalE [Hyphomicrobiales bacterium]